MTPAPHRPIPQPIRDLAHDVASFGACILFVGGMALFLIAIGGTTI